MLEMNALKRTLQYAGVSLLGAGARFTEDKSKLNQALNKRMAEKMAGMKGVPLKICQVLGMSEEQGREIHRHAQVNLEPMPRDQVLDVIYENAPQLIRNGQLMDDHTCASLGQVNHLKCADGKEYAVKIQYPESSHNLNLDDKAFKLMTNSFSGFANGFNLKDYQKTLSQELKQELDYMREMEMQHEFYRVFSVEADIIIPLSYKRFSSRSCLVMDWQSSMPVDEFLQVASEDQCKIANKLITNFYMTSIFRHGLLHADPNPGNFGFRIVNNRVQLVVYDFGAVIKLNKRQHHDLLALFKAAVSKSNPLPALLSVGFNYDLLLPLKEKLSAMMMVLLEPFISEGKFTYKTWQRKERVKDILGEDRWNFMVAAPANLFLFMRSINGLFYYTNKLTGSIYCRPLLEQMFNTFKPELVKIEQSFANDFPEDRQRLSDNMIISIIENGSQKVKLTLPARAIENLPAFIPDDVAEKMVYKGIDIPSLVKKVRRNAYKPQSVFELIDGSKEISVYLT